MNKRNFFTYTFFILCTIGSFGVMESAQGQTRIAQEDFETFSDGPLTEVNPTPEISRAARPFWGTEIPGDLGGVYSNIGNPGKAASAHVGPYTNDHSYSEPKFRFDNKFNNSQEVYVKFDIRIDPNLGTSNETREIGNFKIILITDESSASTGAWHPQINFEPGDDSYSLYTWSQGSGYSEYYFPRFTIRQNNHLMDNAWHTIEIYMHIGDAVVVDKYDESADGIVRIWEDSVLILEDISAPFRTSADEGQGINSMAFIRHAKALGAPVAGMNGHIYFDNIEVWDAMPLGPTYQCNDSLDNDSDTLTDYPEDPGCLSPSDDNEYNESITSTRFDTDTSTQVNIIDALLTQRSVLALDMAPTNWVETPTTGDVDCSGDRNIIDAALIQRYSLGLDMSSTSWCAGG